MESSKVEFFPITSVKFLRNTGRPQYVINEDLAVHQWMGDGPLIITYSTSFQSYFGCNTQGEKFQYDLEQNRKEGIQTLNRFTSRNLRLVVKPDIEISQEELNEHSFLIYCTPPSTIFLKYLDQKFPIKVEDGKIIVNDRTYDDETLQLNITIPSPLNPDRFWTVVMGSTPESALKGFYMADMGKYVIRKHKDMIEKGDLVFNPNGGVATIKESKQYPYEIDWECTTSANHLFCVRPGSSAQRDIEQLIALHEDACERIYHVLGIKTEKDKFICYVRERKTEDFGYGRYERHRRAMHTVYNQERRGKSYSGPHELVHAIIDRNVGFKLPQCWSEGLATLLGGFNIGPVDFHAAESMYSNSLITLEEILSKDVCDRYAPIDSYSQSASFIKFITDRHGWSSFMVFVKEVSKEHARVFEIFEQIFNTPLQTIEKKWKDHIINYLSDNRAEIELQRPYWSARRHNFNKKYAATLSEIEIYSRTNENDPYGYFIAGEALFNLDNLNVSSENFLKAVSLPVVRPEDGRIYRESYLYLGRIQDLLEKRDLAIDYYNQVLSFPEYDDTHDDARRFLESPYRPETKMN